MWESPIPITASRRSNLEFPTQSNPPLAYECSRLFRLWFKRITLHQTWFLDENPTFSTPFRCDQKSSKSEVRMRVWCVIFFSGIVQFSCSVSWKLTSSLILSVQIANTILSAPLELDSYLAYTVTHLEAAREKVVVVECTLFGAWRNGSRRRCCRSGRSGWTFRLVATAVWTWRGLSRIDGGPQGRCHSGGYHIGWSRKTVGAKDEDAPSWEFLQDKNLTCSVTITYDNEQ